jgi:hypothetical protein
MDTTLTIVLLFIWVLFFLLVALNRYYNNRLTANEQESAGNSDQIINLLTIAVFILLLIITAFPVNDYLKERSIVRYESEDYNITHISSNRIEMLVTYDDHGKSTEIHYSIGDQGNLSYTDDEVSTVSITRYLDESNRTVKMNYDFRINQLRTDYSPYPGTDSGGSGDSIHGPPPGFGIPPGFGGRPGGLI